MAKFVLDANLFFNMEPGLGLGKKTQEVVEVVTSAIKERKKQGETFLIPPRVVDEFLSFFEDKEQGFLQAFLREATIQSPQINKSTFPAEVFYELIGDIRERSYRGLIIAQEEMEAAVRDTQGKHLSQKKEFQIAVGARVKRLRDRYRQATRFGFIDSIADLDLIILASQEDATLISADEGVVKWGRRFGVREMTPILFGQHLRQALSPQKQS